MYIAVIVATNNTLGISFDCVAIGMCRQACVDMATNAPYMCCIIVKMRIFTI